MRKAKVFMFDHLAGYLSETDEGYQFMYDINHLQLPNAEAVSLSLPLSHVPFTSERMFSFFDGLIPEGWLLEVAEKNWKLDERDRMGLLMVCCTDCIGAVSIVGVKTEEA
jgi:serine/threonine-protein kinase HipA